MNVMSGRVLRADRGWVGERALVVTPMVPPRGERDRMGMQRRVSAFLHGMAPLFGRIDMLHIIPPDSRFDDPAALDAAQSAFWGVPVHAHCVVRREEPGQPWQDHGLGLFDVGQQHPFRRYTSPDVVAAVAEQLRRGPDFVFADRIEAMLPIVRTGLRTPRLLFDLNDVEHKVGIGALRGGMTHAARVLKATKLPALFVEERRAAGVSGATAVCSDVDRAHLRRLGFGRKIVTVPNAVAVPDTVPGVTSAPVVLFLGACSYAPNVEAAERLVRQVWPLIRAACPDARLIVAGAGTDRLASSASGPAGVEYRGFVPDLAALYAESRVICCPLLRGGGTRLKLVEGAAYARPMVSTRMGAEGLSFTDRCDILLRESDAEIADGCLMLLQDDALCARLGDAARMTMGRLYDVRAVVAQIGGLIQTLCAVP